MKISRIFLCLTLVCVCGLPAFAGKDDRGIISLKGDKTPFIEKGGWTIGGTASGSTYGATNYQFAVVKGVGGDGYSFSIKPGASYAVLNDLCIGVNALYERNKIDLQSAGISLGKISIDIKDYYLLSHNYGAELLCRKFFPLGNSGRFAIYVDGSLQIGGGQSKITNQTKDTVLGTYQTSCKLGLFVNPGLAMYLTPHCMMNLGVGIFGVDYSWVNQIHNQVDTGSRNGFGASYFLNIFALSFGVHYCF